MKPIKNNKAFVVALDLQDIVETYKKFKMPNPDAPTEGDLVKLRDLLPVKDPEVVSLHWLRNRVVTLRKNGNLPKSDD